MRMRLGMSDSGGGCGWAKCDFSEAVWGFRAAVILMRFRCDRQPTLSPRACDDGDDDDACLPS